MQRNWLSLIFSLNMVYYINSLVLIDLNKIMWLRGNTSIFWMLLKLSIFNLAFLFLIGLNVCLLQPIWSTGLLPIYLVTNLPVNYCIITLLIMFLSECLVVYVLHPHCLIIVLNLILGLGCVLLLDILMGSKVTDCLMFILIKYSSLVM